jgi:hypothetical protein
MDGTQNRPSRGPGELFRGDVMDETPYDELDPPVVGLCRALNALPGIWTAGSCGGHEKGGAFPADRWFVSLGPELRGRVPFLAAWLSIEHVAWVLTDFGRGRAVEFHAAARPPFLNEPGHMLAFEVHGWRSGEDGASPEELADFLRRVEGHR